jgi:hypothetical protein
MDKKAPVSISILLSQQSVSCLQALADTGLFGIGGAAEVASRFIDERIQHYVREGWLPMPAQGGARSKKGGR